MATRNREKKPDFEIARKIYRASCPRHVLCLEANMSEKQKRAVFRISKKLCRAGNDLTAILKKNYEQLYRTREYRRLLREYHAVSEKLQNVNKGTPLYKERETELKHISAKLKEMQAAYHVTWDDARVAMIDIYPKYGLNSVYALTRAEDVWKGMEAVLYGNGRNIHFKKRGDLPIIRAKQIEKALILQMSNGKLTIRTKDEKIGIIGLKIKHNDLFAAEEIDKLIDFLMAPDQEDQAVMDFALSGVLNCVFRPCFCALKCDVIRGKLRVFVQITIAANPLPKKRVIKSEDSPQKGEIVLRHHFATEGRVAVDLGPQSYAALSSCGLILDNLAERNGRSTKASEAKEVKLARQLDRSRRTNNPQNYNEDGTIKKGRKRWKNSKTYKKRREKLREIRRKNAASRKYANQEAVNTLRWLGNELIIEPSNVKSMQRKAKASHEYIDKKGRKRNTSRKRHGRSILHRSPGAFQADAKKKFGKSYHEVDRMFRASQYDHESDSYKKKELSERTHVTASGRKVQRDCYSSFLEYCADDTYSHPDRELCIQNFDWFYGMEERLIQHLRDTNQKICNSGI